MMHHHFSRAVASMAALAIGVLSASSLFAGDGNNSPGKLTAVQSANHKAAGLASPNILSPELTEVLLAQGPFKLENTSELTNFYGYDNDGPMLPAPGDLPSLIHKVEASKTEPDKNTYLVLQNQHGADPHYDYGTHFLFQGHELGAGGNGYITRINLDADGTHRVTLLATTDVNGQALPTIDGSTWYPFSQSSCSVPRAAPTPASCRRHRTFHPRSKISPASSVGAATKGCSLTELAG